MCNPILFSLFVQNVEIKDLDFSYAFLLFRREIFFELKILQAIVVCFNKKFCPEQILLHLTWECIITNISLSYVDFVFSFGLNVCLLKEMGCSSCMRTPPRLVPEASHSRMNVFVKLGAANTSVDVIRVFNF